MKKPIPSTLKNEYTNRINKVMDHVEKNIGNAFTLEELAGIASFSKFHFNRIFQAMTGESPFQFIQRIRIEKAANQLMATPHLSISEIAINCGFSDISLFSRTFRQAFGISATGWRKTGRCQESNLSQEHRNILQNETSTSMYFCRETKTLKWKTNMEQMKKVEVKELPAMTLAYVRYTGPYQGNSKLFESLWGRICGWAGPRGILGRPETQFIVVYHDDPNITEPGKLRMSVSLSISPETRVDGEIGKMELEGGKYVVALFDLDATEFPLAWGWVYGSWLPESGYQPGDGPCFERYVEEPKDNRFKVEICVPVRPL